MANLGFLSALAGGATAFGKSKQNSLLEALGTQDQDRQLKEQLEFEGRREKRDLDKENRQQARADVTARKLTMAEIAGLGASEEKTAKFFKRFKGDPDDTLAGLQANLRRVGERKDAKTSLLSRIDEGEARGIWTSEDSFAWKNEIEDAPPGLRKQVQQRISSQLVATTGDVATERNAFQRQQAVDTARRAQDASDRAAENSRRQGETDAVNISFVQSLREEQSIRKRQSEIVTQITGIEGITMDEQAKAQLMSEYQALDAQVNQIVSLRQGTDLPLGVDDGEENKKEIILAGQTVWKAQPTPETETALRQSLSFEYPPEEVEEILLQIKGEIPDVGVNRGEIDDGPRSIFGGRLNPQQARNRARLKSAFTGFKSFLADPQIPNLGQPRDRPTLFPGLAKSSGLKGP